MSDSDVIARRAARVIVVDGAGRVLMFNGHDPGNPADRFWLTVGGGIEPGEDAATAAARELAEETGLQLSPDRLGEPVWRDVTEFPFNGRRYRQEQVWFLVRVASWQVDRSGHNELEQRYMEEHRWFGPEDFATATDPYYPSELPDLLRRLGVA
jgi:8-oxo-dGTP pyrophosphatase MutT (NUDIX family)